MTLDGECLVYLIVGAIVGLIPTFFIMAMVGNKDDD